MPDYDIITVGGGFGGAALAKAMAENGARVLVLERDKRFKDRVRGEWMSPWGVFEAEALGLRGAMVDAGARALACWDNFFGPVHAGRRDFTQTTQQALPALTFYHPQIQETLAACAEDAGAEVRRGVRVRSIVSGSPASVAVDVNGHSEQLSARLVVGADGRGSMVRKEAGFEVRHDPGRLLIGGLFFEGSGAAEDAATIVMNPFLHQAALVFPQGAGRVRCYFGCRVEAGLRLQGEKDVPRFIDESLRTGLRPEVFDGATHKGPLATFQGADEWADHPYRDGVALVGDAAATSDPTWGQGLSLTLRDVRALRDRLLADDDWDRAGHAYAEDHDRHYKAIHAAEDWFTQLLMDEGPAADARRMRALPLIGQDPTRAPDVFFSGPQASPLDEAAKKRFFGEDM